MEPCNINLCCNKNWIDNAIFSFPFGYMFTFKLLIEFKIKTLYKNKRNDCKMGKHEGFQSYKLCKCDNIVGDYSLGLNPIWDNPIDWTHWGCKPGKDSTTDTDPHVQLLPSQLPFTFLTGNSLSLTFTSIFLKLIYKLSFNIWDIFFFNF